MSADAIQVKSGRIVRLDSALDAIVAESAAIEKLAGGFSFTEGPVWIPEGYLLFSDIPENTIYKWSPDTGIEVFRKPSGCYRTGVAPGVFRGSNGLTLDAQGRLTICEHGNRRVTRLEADGSLTVLASHFEGKRLNSPNDLVYKSDGALYFSDPPYGFPKQDDDREKELDFCGLYRLAGGELQLLYKDLRRPNGLGFSPDEKYLYVSNSDPQRRIWMRFEVQGDGSIANGEVFYDVTNEAAAGSPDGLKVDKQGNLYCTGPLGVWIFTPDGKLLGRIEPPERPANCHWGGADAKTLYITAQTSLYRIRTNIEGIRP